MELPYSTKHLIDAFHEADTDKDGKIDSNEFVQMIISRIVPEYNEQLDIAFDIFDYDKDAVITTNDLRKFAVENGEDFDEEELLEMINEADLACKVTSIISYTVCLTNFTF